MGFLKKAFFKRVRYESSEERSTVIFCVNFATVFGSDTAIFRSIERILLNFFSRFISYGGVCAFFRKKTPRFIIFRGVLIC